MHSVALILLVLSSIPATLPCAVDPLLAYGIVETMLETDFIVYGQYQGEDSVTGHGMFRVYCKLRANDMPENITIQLDSSRCSPTEMSNSTDYILMLRTLPTPDRDTYRLAEPSKDTSAAFPATADNLRLAVNVCGLDADEIDEPDNATQDKKTCPTRTATSEDDCVSKDPETSRAASVSSVGSLLLLMMLGVLALL